MRRHLQLIALALAVSASPAHAVFGEDHWLSGQNQIMAAQLAEMAKQNAELVRLVLTSRDILYATNEAAAYARTAYRQLQMTRNYTLEDAFEDARKGFYRAFPEVAELDREARAAAANGRALYDGRFWVHTDHHDRGALKRLEERIRYAFKGQIWPADEETAKHYRPSIVDSKLDAYFKASGLTAQRAVQSHAYVTFAERVRVLSEDAAHAEHLPTSIAAHSAEMNTQTMRNTTELLDHAKARTARDQNAVERDKAFRKRFASSLRTLLVGRGSTR